MLALCALRRVRKGVGAGYGQPACRTVNAGGGLEVGAAAIADSPSRSHVSAACSGRAHSTFDPVHLPGVTRRAPDHLYAVVLAATLTLAAPTAGGAQPACVAGTLESYLGLGAAGCTIGGVRVRDFARFVLRGEQIPGFVNYAGPALLTPFQRPDGGGMAVGFTISFAPAVVNERTFLGQPNPSFFQTLAGVTFTADPGEFASLTGLRVFDVAGTATRSDLAPAGLPGAALYDGSVGIENVGNVIAYGVDECISAPTGCVVFDNAWRDFTPMGVSRTTLLGSVRIGAHFDGCCAGYLTPVTYRAELASFTGGVVSQAGLQPVPEPSTFALAAVGSLALLATAARRRRSRAGGAALAASQGATRRQAGSGPALCGASPPLSPTGADRRGEGERGEIVGCALLVPGRDPSVPLEPAD